MMKVLNESWEKILNMVRLDADLSDIAYETWLLPLRPYDIDENKIYIAATNELIIQHIQRRFRLFLDIAVAEVLGKRYMLEFTSEEKIKAKKKVSYKNVVSSGQNKKYTFDTFVVGENNRFAQISALAVAEMPGEIYNPLYIHGGAGLGKTHLLKAIQEYILERNPEKKVIYVSTEQFANQVIETLRLGGASDMVKLREKYRTADVLLIDDIQFLIGKEATQQHFFHTYNDLHAEGRQIVITSDRPPKELATLNERYISRCEWGLMANIDPPAFETRMDILKKQTELLRVKVDEDILEYIANHFTANIRELEGALKRLVAYSRLTNIPVTLEDAKRELSLYISPEEKKEVTVQLIIETVAEHYKLSTDDIISHKRDECLVKPRHIAMYLCDDIIKTPVSLIGAAFGDRNHSTVIYARNKIRKSILVDNKLCAEIEVIKKKINPN